MIVRGVERDRSSAEWQYTRPTSQRYIVKVDHIVIGREDFHESAPFQAR